MNTTFNINRLFLLFKRYFIENKQRELTFWGIATVIFMILHQEGSVEMFLYIAGFIFAARTFKVFNYTPGGMHYLLIPATSTEKLTVNIILSIVYFFVMILISYIIGTVIGTFLGNLIFNLHNPIHFGFFYDSISNQWNHQKVNPNGLFEIFMSFALIQSIFILGSIYFKGNVIGKTFLTFIALAFILGLFEIFLLKVTFGTYHLDGHMLRLTIPEGTNLFPGFEVAGKIIKYSLIPFFWIVSYFRLTEKQV
jgi:hypothetical protein